MGPPPFGTSRGMAGRTRRLTRSLLDLRLSTGQPMRGARLEQQQSDCQAYSIGSGLLPDQLQICLERDILESKRCLLRIDAQRGQSPLVGK